MKCKDIFSVSDCYIQYIAIKYKLLKERLGGYAGLFCSTTTLGYFPLVLAYFCIVHTCTSLDVDCLVEVSPMKVAWFQCLQFPYSPSHQKQQVDGAITLLVIAGVHSYRDFLPNSENKMGAHIQFNTSNPLIEWLYRIIMLCLYFTLTRWVTWGISLR